MSISNYLEKLNKHYQSGYATEHTYRGDFAELVASLAPDMHITNEPSNVTDCGNPDFVITKNKIPVGFIEAKDLGKDLNSKQFKEQFGRYRKALNNLIITDYVWFQFFQNGELIHEIRIAEIEKGKIKPIPETFTQFENLIIEFCNFIAQTIKSPKTLAKMMAAKARLLENILENATSSDEQNEENTALKQQYETFKEILIHDLTPQGFADIYAQTLAYGMFAARLHDKTFDTFSRQEAAELIPKTNPFLRKLFSHVAGVDIDERIVTTVDNLADVFRATNVEELLKNFGKATQTQDPIIHFYETFLSEYDPKLRKARGVWYTPKPVVNFIIRGVDQILKTEFGLQDGLADTSKTSIEVEAQGTAVTKGRGKGKRLTETKQVHKVQVLDPATGTGTFLAEVVNHIYKKKFRSMKGAWSGYVEEHLIPRLNGFELLMASYSMAHLKLDMLLTETGYKSSKSLRFNIFLTNSLEEYHPDTGTLFSSWLSTEANEANYIKRDKPVMIVMGNPPYAVSSSNSGPWIQELLGDYKKGLDEKKLNLDDDYIKFIRFAQNLINKNGEGIVAFITNNSFLEGVTHRGMRSSLLKDFNKIYILDLHGNSKKKEKNPSGGVDENVFDIMQGVSICFLVKDSSKTKDLFFHELYGTRSSKYEFLDSRFIDDVAWSKVSPKKPYFFFGSKYHEDIKEYNKYFYIKDLFKVKNNGLKTDRDLLFIDFDKVALKERIKHLLSGNLSNDFVQKYNVKDSGSYKITQALRDKVFSEPHVNKISYRPFDVRWIYYDPDLISRPAAKVMKHMLAGDNLCLILPRQIPVSEAAGAWVSNSLCGHKTFSAYNINTAFPLYLYNDSMDGKTGTLEKIHNLEMDIIKEIDKSLGLSLKEGANNRSLHYSPEDLFDYIYAVLHCPKYLRNYREQLEIDFPRIPFPSDQSHFWRYAETGRKLRKTHFLDFETDEDESLAIYPNDGDNEITRKILAKDWEVSDSGADCVRVWINDKQYFDGIPREAWEMLIGGFHPAQKWLKDRVGRKLNYEEISTYLKIVEALKRTSAIESEIESIGIGM